MTHKIIDEGGGLVFRIRVDVGFEEVMTALQQAWEHPGWDRHRYQIWDFGNVVTLGIDKGDARAIAIMDGLHAKNTMPIKSAFIAKDENLIELFDAYAAGVESENLEVRIFTDEASARKWVGA